MSTIANGHVVKMNYTLTNKDGQILDSSEGKGPLAFIVGNQNIIPGLEKEIIGKAAGDKFKATIQPEEAYGVRSEELVQTVPKTEFGTDIDKIQIGTQFQVQNEAGQAIVVTAVEIKEDSIVLDANHPLAGEVLNFDVEIVEAREATSEEMAHGHVHEDGKGCGH